MEVKVSFVIAPISLKDANQFVQQHHRHHGRVAGHKFSLSVIDSEGIIRGVAIVGRPVARMLDNGLTLEVTRLATDGCPNACSALYAACWRAARALGYTRLGTYTLKSESGGSLRGAGWRVVNEVRGESWNRPSRSRPETTPTPKLRWEPAQ